LLTGTNAGDFHPLTRSRFPHPARDPAVSCWVDGFCAGLVAAPLNRMNANSAIEEMQRELAQLQAEHEILMKSHRRLVSQVFGETPEAQQFLGQMAVDRMKLYPHWLKTSA
jgi:hypothetical protein